jgi:nitrogen PTS system EIIA component
MQQSHDPMTTSHYAMKPEAVAIMGADDKDAILAALARLMADAWGLDAAVVLERLDERERLGSTGFGRSVAIPHARIPGLKRSVAGLIRLTRPVEFNAADGMPVDLVFGLLSPEHCGAMHLHALASISRLLRDERMHEALSEAPDAEAIYGLLTNATDRDAA